MHVQIADTNNYKVCKCYIHYTHISAWCSYLSYTFPNDRINLQKECMFNYDALHSELRLQHAKSNTSKASDKLCIFLAVPNNQRHPLAVIYNRSLKEEKDSYQCQITEPLKESNSQRKVILL